MATSTPLEIVVSYIDLLIMQYLNKPNASGTIRVNSSAAIIPQASVQLLTFSPTPTSGAFVLSYDGEDTVSIAWNADATAIQAAIAGITALADSTVTGTIATGISITLAGSIYYPALMLEVTSNTLEASSVPTDITIVETDVTLPIAVQDGFNLIEGTDIAQGVQLDVIGKYTGVSRTGQGFTTQITLDDSDFLSLIRMAIVKNSSGSSLATIQTFLNQFFPDQIYVFDYQNMNMSFVISQEVGSQDLVQMFITQGLLPIPMAVNATVIYVPTANLFSFRTYDAPSTTGSPFNTYEDYQMNYPWLTYEDVI